MARDNDGDLTKFVQNVKKPFDTAQKWRAFKNFTRIWKNPFGYFYWKTETFAKHNRLRYLYIQLVVMLWSSLWTTLICRTVKESYIKSWKFLTGQINSNYTTINSKTMPYDRHKNYLRYSNFHQVRRQKRLGMMHSTNWWCRDQNFRKYFEMRKKNDIRPSEKGFYHEPLMAEAIKTNCAIRDQRYSRLAA